MAAVAALVSVTAVGCGGGGGTGPSGPVAKDPTTGKAVTDSKGNAISIDAANKFKSGLEAMAQHDKADDWNDLVIRCEGPRIQIWVGSLQTVDYTEADDKILLRGRFGLQIHGGEPAEAAYKDIRIKRLGQSK